MEPVDAASDAPTRMTLQYRVVGASQTAGCEIALDEEFTVEAAEQEIRDGLTQQGYIELPVVNDESEAAATLYLSVPQLILIWAEVSDA